MLIHEFDDEDQAQKSLEQIGLEIHWETFNRKRTGFAWVELKPESIKGSDREYFSRKGSRVIANIRKNRRLYGFEGHPIEQKYLQRYAELLPSKN